MSPQAPRLVLLVEDADLCSVTLEIALLALPNVTVRSTSRAEEALTELDGGSVGAIITDLHLPGMDGFELLARIRREPRFARIPVVVISGDTDPRTPDRVRRLGAAAFFPKPYSPAQVRQKVEELLNA